MEEYRRIREMVMREGLSRRETARRLRHSRHTIRKALEHAEPPGYRRGKEPDRPRIDPVKGLIDAWLEEDRKAPRKQRHTAQRIWERLTEEYEFQGHPSTVRRYVAQGKAVGGQVYTPLVFDPGEEAQFDWGQAVAVIAGEERSVFLFCSRLCHSTASYARAYESEKTEAVLDGHVRAFEFFGGVPRQGAYDNPRTMVKEIGRGHERKLTERFEAMVSHYVLRTRFCNVRCANEKGHVENLVKHVQQAYLTPVPHVASLEELNAHLARCCEADLDRPAGRGRPTRRQLLEEERRRFLPLPRASFEACVKASRFASKLSFVEHETNRYSVPVAYAYRSCTVSAFVDRIELFVEAERVAVHARSYGKHGYVLDWRHYVPLLERKPGALANGRPYKGEPWGEAMEEMRRALEVRYGGDGTKKFVRALLLFTEFPEAEVKRAVALCVRRRAYSDEAVRAELTYVPPRRLAPLDLSDRPALAGVASEARPAATYDALLVGEARP